MMSLVVNESDVTKVNVFNLDIELDFKENAIGLQEFTSWHTRSYQILVANENAKKLEMNKEKIALFKFLTTETWILL